MIGWYVHHHGMGHLSRARAVRPHLQDVTLFGSVDAPDVVPLPLDVDPRGPAGPQPAANLHHAPVGVAGLTRRMATLAAWIDRAAPDLFVVDVSVEVATFVRLMGVPTVVVRQHGRRDDPPHLMAYDHASLLLAPWSPQLEDPWVPGWVRSRTAHVGGFSRFDGRLADRTASRRRLGIDGSTRPVVLVTAGGEGAAGWDPDAAAAATPGWQWVVVGGVPSTTPRLRHLGWLDDPWDWLCAADVVITHAGHNSTMEAAAAGTPMVVIPQPRPFDEQVHKAAALDRCGAALVRTRWPSPHEWGGLLAQARTFRTRTTLVDGHGSQRAAVALQGAALGLTPQPCRVPA